MDGLHWRKKEGGLGVGGGEFLSAPGSHVHSVRLTGRKGLFFGAGKCADNMISLVGESCLFTNIPPSLIHSLPSSFLLLLLLLFLLCLYLYLFCRIKTTTAKDKGVSFAKLAVFFVTHSPAQPWNTAIK